MTYTYFKHGTSVYSGYRDRRDRWTEIESKGYHFMEKPFTVSGLLAAVGRALSGETPQEAGPERP